MPFATESPDTTQELYRLVRERLVPRFGELARCRSTRELERHPTYRELEPLVRRVLASVETGGDGPAPAPARERYRFVAWNLERGIELDGQLDALRRHPYLRRADVLLLTETDLGMARSANRAVARELAEGLGMHYAFAPCYINLAKGAGVENDVPGENELGLHGNALLSRYPLDDVRIVRLANGKDKMRGREKRIGSQAAVVADVVFPQGRVRVASVHLDAQSTQRHRRDQMAAVLDALGDGGPALVGGDWNTTTYDSSSALRAILGFWRRVLMGVDHVIRDHYLHPDRYFERELFAILERRGFDTRRANRLGEPTIAYDVADAKTRRNLGEWVPGWCFAFIRWALREHGGRCPLKIDWFATRELTVRDPVVLHDLRGPTGRRLSDHDAIGVDVVAARWPSP